MGLDSVRDIDVDDGRPAARRHYRDESQYWGKRDYEPSYALPRHRRPQEQRPDERGSRRRDGRPMGFDATDSTIPPPPPPPPPPFRERSATEAYRRPRPALVYDYESDSADRQPRSRRDPSPGHRPRHVPRHSPQYLSDGSGSQRHGGGEEDEHIEVIVEDGDESPRGLGRRQSSRDEYIGYGRRRRYHRNPRARQPSDDGFDSRRPRSISPGDSPVRERDVARIEHSESPRKTRHIKSADVIEDSRPPVSSKKATKRGRRPVSEGHQDDIVQRSRSNTSRAASASSRRSGIFGAIFQPARRLAPEPLVQCVVCMGDIPQYKTARLRCGHVMCNSCLSRSFRLSVSDPQHMPPRCCTKHPISLKHVDRLFDDAFKKNWNRKFAEYSTKNRIYCPSKKCGEWIKPANITTEHGRKVARCGRCKTKVCGACNGKWHTSDDCPKDEETLRFLAQAQQEGWKRCYKCRAIVELEAGCNHMTCRCGAEFCMICGMKWKTCNCPWFTYGDANGPMDEPLTNDGGGRRPYHEDEMSSRGPNPFTRDHWSAVAGSRQRPPATYEEEMHRRQRQEQVDEEYARALDEGANLGYGRPLHGDAGDDRWNAASAYQNLRTRSVLLPSRTPHHSPPVDRDGRPRGGSMERRLADRFSENRQSTRAWPGGRPPPPPEAMGAPMPPVHRPTRGPPPIVGEPMYDEPPRRRRTERRSARYIEEEQEEQEDDEVVEGYRPRVGRRRSRREEEPAPALAPALPKSSTLAGLNGVGRGMNRVFEWRNFVAPGIPEGEGPPEIMIHGIPVHY